MSQNSIMENAKEGITMADHVIRYVVTHIGKDGLRTLCGPAQGRHTNETHEEAQQMLDSMMVNNLVEGDCLARVYGLPLEVHPVKCYPGHFDPMGIYFDSISTVMDIASEAKELRVIAENDTKLASQNGIDLNPFSTQGARTLWQQGWDGVRPANLTDGSTYWRYWERGRQACSITQEKESVSERPRG
jgi:hypothetical protein